MYDFLPKRKDYLRNESVEILRSVGLAEKADETASLLSYGDQRRLEIAITLALQPKLLILDEPTAGVARAEGYEIMKMIKRLASEKNMTVVFIEHDMEIVFNYSDRISVIRSTNPTVIAVMACCAKFIRPRFADTTTILIIVYFIRKETRSGATNIP